MQLEESKFPRYLYTKKGSFSETKKSYLVS
nr:MAG TPA: hypothetical protein [Caudoviricetes sp.]